MPVQDPSLLLREPAGITRTAGSDLFYAQGLGDLAAHLVAFHNMGASPTHDDPFPSGVKVDFDDGSGHGQGHEPGEPSPLSTHSEPQRHSATLMDQGHSIDATNRVWSQSPPAFMAHTDISAPQALQLVGANL